MAKTRAPRSTRKSTATGPRPRASATRAARAPRAKGTASRANTARKAAKQTAATTSTDQARTIVYVHGIGNKPEETVLRCQWDHALMGFGLGERSRMAYWCQADRHGPPEHATCADADTVSARTIQAGGFGARAIARAAEREQPLGSVVKDLTGDPLERAALTRLLNQMGGGGRAGMDGAKRAAKAGAKGLGDIDFFDPLTRLLTALFLKDVNDFFFDRRRRAAMKDRLRERLAAGNGPFVVVAHSQGSMIAWSVLHELGTTVDVAQLVTIGSPLGLAEVRNQLRRLHGLGSGTLPVPAGVRAWVNVFAPLDAVAQRERLAPHYTGAAVPVDNELPNRDGPRDAHSATGYLRLPFVQQQVRGAVDLQRFQRTAQFTIAADVTTDFERAAKGERRPLLIELTDPVWAMNKLAAMDAPAEGPMPESRAEMADRVVELVEGITGLEEAHHELGVQRLERYVSVRLTESEAQRLSATDELKRLGLALPPLYRVWRNARKFALLDKSIQQVQAAPAHQAYSATGRGIQWAVLDSGCTPHPHFRQHANIAARWDCTKLSDAPVRDGEKARDGKGDSTDHYGHGTHVAGIIAGAYEFASASGKVPRLPKLSGIAPHAGLHIYKVLDNDGVGDDSWIIKALDHISAINDKAGSLEIAGVNLSLGGEFEQGVFGCGHTPLCDELRRLWRQGVVVVLAAGNEGFRRLMSTDGDFGANLPCSIGDPANLEEAIAVGSVHKEKPHTYGVSHFSSRGPTADGRNKPDCVAPGEQILSCRHDLREASGQKALTSADLYYKLDGTSMAAPHVSGLVACFLSLRREFIGQPDKVKRILLDNCTDLGRDRAMQGAGMPNLVKMLVQT
ncbi:MAG TPA: S8 family peptidase [Vicinamibacterales bacterium]|nr:S8 family peptidase [Vicinamibacterales bacterium]